MSDSVESDLEYWAIRRAVLDELRRIVSIQDSPHRNDDLQTRNLVQDVAQHHTSWPVAEIWRAVFDLFSEGVLVPVSRVLLRDPKNGGMHQFGPEIFTITDYGKRFLESTKDQPDPSDAESILNPLRARNISNETVESYIPEAVRSLSARAYRATVLMVGVAAEAVSEDIYEAFKAHLSESERSSFLTALNKKANSAEARWNVFRDRFPQRHAECVGDELKRRFENVLEPQLKLFKQNRDDAAHRRATLIGPETSRAALTSFIPFGQTAADVIDALGRQCKVDGVGQ